MKKKTSGSSSKGEAPSRLIDARIRELEDWRGEMLSGCVLSSNKPIPPSSKNGSGGGFPSGLTNGMICTGETYKSVVKLTFFKGAQMKDPKKLFNSSLEGNARRAIDFHEGDKVNEAAFKALIREAVTVNAR